MHNILLVIDPQDNKCKWLSTTEKEDFIKNLCERVQYHAEEENDDILGTLDKRYVSEEHPFIFEDLKQTILGIENLKFPIQYKRTAGCIDIVNQMFVLHKRYQNEGGIKVEVCGMNTDYEVFSMAMSLKTLIEKIEVEINTGCTVGKLEETVPLAMSMGISIIDM